MKKFREEEILSEETSTERGKKYENTQNSLETCGTIKKSNM